MKKAVIFIITLTLLLSSVTVSYAANFSDISGTNYENAVTTLASMNIITGYSDGTYRPDSLVSRAEMATILIKTVDKINYENVVGVPFEDVRAHWAESYITLAYSLGAINGRSDASFAPNGKVTHVEAVAMLLRSMGYADVSLAGNWPSNYLNKARELGLFENIEVNEKGSANATRGDVALMASVVAQTIRDRWVEASTTTEPATTTPDNGRLNNYNGRAIGIPLSISTVLASSGSIVDEIEYRMSETVYKLRTEKSGTISTATFIPYTGDLYVARMSNGIVKTLEKASAVNVARYVELTKDGLGVGNFLEVTQNRGDLLTVSGGAISEFGYANEGICYKAVFDGDNLESFDAVSVSHIDAGDYVRAWDLDEDWAGIAVVVVLIDENDVTKAVNYGIL